MRTPTENTGREEARLYRNEIRGLEQERIQLRAAELAGRDYDEARADELDKRIGELEKAAKAAEARDAKKEG